MQSPNLEVSDFPPLVFERMLVLVGGGSVDIDLLRHLYAKGARVVAADGGATACEAAGIVPVAIVGDMDSLVHSASWAEKTQILHIAEQESTDFEKSLYSTRAPLTIALGMTGKRFDHTLAAVDVVARYADQRRVVLVDEEDIALAISGAFSFSCKVGERVSVHPLRKVKFYKSQGLKYALDGLTLAPGVRTGTSNEAIGEHVEIVPDPEQGPWLLILSRQRLDTLVRTLETI